MVALTVYGTNTASASTLTTADILVTGTGAASTTVGTKCASGAQTAWGELHSQAFASNWPVSGAIGAASGHGWILDATTLEGQQIAAGNWTPTLNLRYLSSNGTATADIHVRAFKRSSGGVYTQIGTDMVLAAQALTSATAQYTFAATSEAAMSFGVGDKLYIDIWLNITANANTISNAQINVTIASSSTQGVANDCQIVTPGYSSNTTTSTRTVPATAALIQTSTRTISDTAALLVTSQRTISTTAALIQTSKRTVPTTAALLQTNKRTIPDSAALMQTNKRTIGATAALLATQKRTMPTSAALIQTSKRTIGAQAALLTTNKRTIPASAALAKARIIPCSVALSMVFNANVMLLVPSGQTTLLVPTGATTLIVTSGQTTLIV